MKKISFLDDAIESVINDQKMETLRLDKKYRIGEVIILARQNGEKLGYLRILDKSKVKFSDLTLEDAVTHNWVNLEELQQRLLKIYPKLKANSILTRYKFTYLKNLPRNK